MPSDHDRIVQMFTHIEYMRKQGDELHTLLKSMNGRVDNLEGFKDKVSAAFGVVALMMGTTWAKILKLF